MQRFMIVPAALLAATAIFGFSTSPSVAADAKHPYQNVDHRNDAGNNTGDDKVEALNNAQLDANYHGPVEMRTPSGVVTPAH